MIKLVDDVTAAVPVLSWRILERERMREMLQSDDYVYELDGVLRWHSTGNAICSHYFKEAGFLSPRNQDPGFREDINRTVLAWQLPPGLKELAGNT